MGNAVLFLVESNEFWVKFAVHDSYHRTKKKAVGSFCWGWFSQSAGAQPVCADRLSYAPVSQANRIEWSKFPQFTLPFTIVFGGPRLGDTQAQPLQHGFSHIVQVTGSEFGTLIQPRQRAVDFVGFAYGLNQPWETLPKPLE